MERLISINGILKMKAIERIIDKAHLDRKRVVLSEAEDPRVLKAARLAIDKQLAYITLVGDEKAIIEAAHLNHINLAGIHIVSPQASALKAVLAERLYELRKAKGMSYEDALEKVKDPLIFANLMVRRDSVSKSLTESCIPPILSPYCKCSWMSPRRQKRAGCSRPGAGS